MLRNMLILIGALAAASAAFSMDIITRSIPDAKLVGEGTFTFALWDVYDATLYAPGGKLNPRKPYALSIRYKTQISGSDIADQSVEEMRKQGFDDEDRLASWNAQMKSIFPNVENGTVLSALFIQGKKTVFYEANQPIGTIRDAEFTRRFSDIWLAQNTSEPALRRKLLGMP